MGRVKHLYLFKVFLRRILVENNNNYMAYVDYRLPAGEV